MFEIAVTVWLVLQLGLLYLIGDRIDRVTRIVLYHERELELRRPSREVERP
jgi:hypothetical protein